MACAPSRCWKHSWNHCIVWSLAPSGCCGHFQWTHLLVRTRCGTRCERGLSRGARYHIAAWSLAWSSLWSLHQTRVSGRAIQARNSYTNGTGRGQLSFRRSSPSLHVSYSASALVTEAWTVSQALSSVAPLVQASLLCSIGNQSSSRDCTCSPKRPYIGRSALEFWVTLRTDLPRLLDQCLKSYDCFQPSGNGYFTQALSGLVPQGL